MSVSVPFLMPSVQVGAATHTPPVQRALVQSVATAQCSPFGHGQQAGPPQSTSVSAPSRMALVQSA
jgi:hypothetical protein